MPALQARSSSRRRSRLDSASSPSDQCRFTTFGGERSRHEFATAAMSNNASTSGAEVFAAGGPADADAAGKSGTHTPAGTTATAGGTSARGGTGVTSAPASGSARPGNRARGGPRGAAGGEGAAGGGIGVQTAVPSTTKPVELDERPGAGGTGGTAGGGGAAGGGMGVQTAVPSTATAVELDERSGAGGKGSRRESKVDPAVLRRKATESSGSAVEDERCGDVSEVG